MTNMNKMSILLADDDSTDRELFIEAINMSGSDYTLKEASNGQEVIDYLNEEAAPIPSFIFLDLNMPIMDGREVLKYLKNSSKHKTIPVLVLSTSNSSYDIKSCYEAGANLFFVKPDDFHELTLMIKNILLLFEGYVALPEIQ